MSAADWFPVNPGKYLKNTLHLTTRQHGGYWLLILAAFEGRGVLPGTDAGLMAIAKLTAREWKEDGAVLKAFLTRRGAEWIHEYVMFEWNEAQERIGAKRRAGKEGARKRWGGRASDLDEALPIAVPLAAPVVRLRQTDAQVQEQKHVTATDRVERAGAGAPKAHNLPADWKPSEELRQYAASKGHDPDILAKAFVDYWTGSKGRKTKREKWDRTFEVWCDRETPKRAPMQTFAQQRDAAATAVAVVDDVQWRARVRGWKPGKPWHGNWGPPPGEKGCRVPAAILAEMQLQEAA